mmetsp:Transcript_43261/g.91993  ORF Transcript_43261/g.91993 Transcript_43261/m.91993 type:complete len:262 (-) Transcript_43261:382-1167(-)
MMVPKYSSPSKSLAILLRTKLRGSEEFTKPTMPPAPLAFLAEDFLDDGGVLPAFFLADLAETLGVSATLSASDGFAFSPLLAAGFFSSSSGASFPPADGFAFSAFFAAGFFSSAGTAAGFSSSDAFLAFFAAGSFGSIVFSSSVACSFWAFFAAGSFASVGSFPSFFPIAFSSSRGASLALLFARRGMSTALSTCSDDLILLDAFPSAFVSSSTVTVALIHADFAGTSSAFSSSDDLPFLALFAAGFFLPLARGAFFFFSP